MRFEAIKEVRCSQCHCVNRFIDGATLRDTRSMGLGVSLRVLAKALGVTAVYLSDIERGNRSCTNPAIISRLEDVLTGKISLKEEGE